MSGDAVPVAGIPNDKVENTSVAGIEADLRVSDEPAPAVEPESPGDAASITTEAQDAAVSAAVPATSVEPENPAGAVSAVEPEGALKRLHRTPPERMGYLMGSLVALVTLIVFAAVVFGVMVGAGAILHHLHPKRQFDVLYALRKPIVVGVLLALSVLWLLPPHPWSKKQKDRRLFRSKAAT